MKYERRNLYVLNKLDKEAIVYEDANGNIIRLTREVFSSEEEFQRYKDWSDAEYHEVEKKRHIHSNNNLSLDGLPEETASVDSAEQEYIDSHYESERDTIRRLLMDGFDACLTKVQRKRLWLYCVERLSEDTIAAAEGVKQQSISESLHAAKNKLRKFLKITL